jgi:hypothetical protein
MRTRLVPWLVLAGLMLALPAARSRADDAKSSDSEPATPFKAALVLRIQSLDELIADARYLAKLAGREAETKEFEKMLKSKTGPKGLEGIDTKKPIGAYGVLKAKLDESQGVLMVPIADEQAFLKFLESKDLKPEKDNTGLYTLQTEMIPFPLVFRFANNYLYATAKYNDKAAEALDKGKLPLPGSVLAGGVGSVLSLTAHLDQIPAQIRKLAISGAALQLSNLKDESLPNETDAQKKLKEATLDEAAELVKSLMTDGRAVKLDLVLDRKKHNLALSLGLGAKDGSTLARNIAALGMTKSVTAGLIGPDSAMGGYFHLTLPAALRKAFSPVVDELGKKAIEDEQDKDKRELLRTLVDALKPTAKAGVIDNAIDIRGPSKGGKYALVLGGAIRAGEEVEKAIKKVLDKAPAAVKKAVKTDVAKVGGVNIHQITPDKMDDFSKETFGDGPIYFAVRKDLAVLSAGEEARDNITAAVSTKEKMGRPMQFQLSVARLARLMEREHKGAQDVAKKVFKDKGSDRVELTLEAGKNTLRLKLSTRTQVIAFGSLLEKRGKSAD